MYEELVISTVREVKPNSKQGRESFRKAECFKVGGVSGGKNQQSVWNEGSL